MEPKNRIFIGAAIISLIVLAIAASFGRSLLLLRIPPVELADTPEGTPWRDSGLEEGVPPYWEVSITPDTLHPILSTLTRPDSYVQEFTVERFWNGTSSSTWVQTWQDEGFTHVRQILSPQVIRHDLLGHDLHARWYEGETTWITPPATPHSTDLIQGIPTYETVLTQPIEAIRATGYEWKQGIPCIYVQLQSPGSPEVTHYWISTTHGLLVAAQQERNGTLVYRMGSDHPIQTPCPPTASFSLPDGQVVHTP